MSRSSYRNRLARERAQQRTTAPGGGRGEPAFTPEDLIAYAAAIAVGPGRDREMLDAAVGALIRLQTEERRDLHGAVATMLTGAVDAAFEHGWQPAELAHVVRRTLDGVAVQLVRIAIADHARRRSAASTAPAEWTAQIDAIDSPDASGTIGDWQRSGTLPSHILWVAQLSLLGLIRGLAPLARLMTVPTEWTSESPRPGAATTMTDAKVLAKIRGLLAKAESTSFTAEAEALSAKAQDLMTRHAIDTAMLDAQSTDAGAIDVATRRVLVDSPYSEAKSALLSAVARSNGVRAVSHPQYGIVTVIGMPVDLDFCELLFTSLLVQAARAMTRSGVHAAQRTPSYRRSFLYAFADGVGDRLEAARDQATRDASSRHGSALVPVMNARAEAVDAAFDEQFPQTTRSARTVSNRAGWVAGRVAAEQADLSMGAGRIVR